MRFKRQTPNDFAGQSDMNSDLLKLYERLKRKGLSLEQEKIILQELYDHSSHDPCCRQDDSSVSFTSEKDVYRHNDLDALQNIAPPAPTYNTSIRSLDELLDRDNQRKKDGFPPKIRIGRMIKPGRGGKDKVVVVPTTVEEKFIHDTRMRSVTEEEPMGGSGEGEEGEIIGEQPVREPSEQGEDGAGQGQDGAHEIESNAYDLGKILTEKYELPNLKDKGKKRSLTRYTYDLTDRHKGFGQFLDKKATLREIIETNIALGNLPDVNNIEPSRFLIAPSDKIYRVLSREKDFESQAMVFFVRDYSGSMGGKPTELVVSQHVLIYSWLLFQYERQVETRFILHDTEAREVPDFYTYYNSKVAGGTQVASAYRLVNETVEKENLIQDYNIYIFHGTDGDDWDTEGKEAIPELKRMLAYANRIGITIAQRTSFSSSKSEVQRYLEKSKLLEERSTLLRLDVVRDDAGEPRLIEGIKKLIS